MTPNFPQGFAYLKTPPGGNWLPFSRILVIHGFG